MYIFIVQECYKFIPNKFELVLIASKRARDISLKNCKTFIEPSKDKPTVISLKEIDQGYKDDFLNDDDDKL